MRARAALGIIEARSILPSLAPSLTLRIMISSTDYIEDEVYGQRLLISKMADQTARMQGGGSRFRHAFVGECSEDKENCVRSFRSP